MITRQLVITQAIEQTILIEDLIEAKDLMSNGHIYNVRQCLCLNDAARVGAGIRLIHGYANTLSSNSIDPYSGPPRMKTDLEFQIRYVLSLWRISFDRSCTLVDSKKAA